MDLKHAGGILHCFSWSRIGQGAGWKYWQTKNSIQQQLRILFRLVEKIMWCKCIHNPSIILVIFTEYSLCVGHITSAFEYCVSVINTTLFSTGLEFIISLATGNSPLKHHGRSSVSFTVVLLYSSAKWAGVIFSFWMTLTKKASSWHCRDLDCSECT